MYTYVHIYVCEYYAYVGNEDYRKRFSKGDVETLFVYVLNKLEELWSNVEFSKLKNVCKRDRRLSDELRSKLTSVNSLEEIFDLLSNSPFCNWLEIRILKCMAEVADVPEATSMLNIFEECVHNRKCSEVEKHFAKNFINPEHLTTVIAKLNKNAKDMIVADLIEYYHSLESFLRLPPESTTLVDSNAGCLEIHITIPCYCCINAYEVAKCRFFKLRAFNIQYLQIGIFPKVFANNVIKPIEAKSILDEISSSHDICKLNNVYSLLF